MRNYERRYSPHLENSFDSRQLPCDSPFRNSRGGVCCVHGYDVTRFIFAAVLGERSRLIPRGFSIRRDSHSVTLGLRSVKRPREVARLRSFLLAGSPGQLGSAPVFQLPSGILINRWIY